MVTLLIARSLLLILTGYPRDHPLLFFEPPAHGASMARSVLIAPQSVAPNLLPSSTPPFLLFSSGARISD